MSSLSVRARLILIVSIFSVIALALTLVSAASINSVREAVSELAERRTVMQLSLSLSRDFEAENAEQNGLAATMDPEEIAARAQEQDRLYKEMDQHVAALTPLLAADERSFLDQFRRELDDYKRIDAQLRKAVTSGESEKATRLLLGEGAALARKIRGDLQRIAEALDKGKSPQAAAAVRGVSVATAALHAGLGELVLETRDASKEEISHANAALLQEIAARLDQLRDGDADAQRAAQHIAPLLDDDRRLHAEIERAAKANTRAHALRLATRADNHVRSVRLIVQQLVAKSAADAESARKNAEQLSARARVLQVLLATLGLVGGGVFALFTVRRVQQGVEAVRRVAVEVADTALQLRQATQTMSHRTSEEASALEETSSTMEQMTVSVDQNRAGAARVRDLAEQTRDAAQQGSGVSREAAEAMRALHEAGHKVSEISETVSELAFQTNILALNASVEAARAGEHGQGFTVVAAEVRTLAQRSATSAKEISALIKDSLVRIERGADLVGRASGEMIRIVDGSREVSSLLGNITTAAQEQSTGIAQVSQAVLQLNQVVQANSAQSEEIAATAENLDLQSRQLVRAVSLITGTVDDLPAAHAALALPVARAFPRRQASFEPEPRSSGALRPSARIEPIHSTPSPGELGSF